VTPEQCELGGCIIPQGEHIDARDKEDDDLLNFDDGEEIEENTQKKLLALTTGKEEEQLGANRLINGKDKEDRWDLSIPFEETLDNLFTPGYKATLMDINEVTRHFKDKHEPNPKTGARPPWRYLCGHFDDSKKCSCRPKCGQCGYGMHLKIFGNAGLPHQNNGYRNYAGTPAFVCPRVKGKYFNASHINDHDSLPEKARMATCEDRKSGEDHPTYIPANMWVKKRIQRIHEQCAKNGKAPGPACASFLNLMLIKDVISALARSRTWYKHHGYTSISGHKLKSDNSLAIVRAPFIPDANILSCLKAVQKR
jgi:hypothetical protein